MTTSFQRKKGLSLGSVSGMVNLGYEERAIQIICQGNIEGAVKGIIEATGKGASSDSAISRSITIKSSHIPLKIQGEFPKVLERVSFEPGQQKSQFRISMLTPVGNPGMTIESFKR